jgi:hypothetical protein
MAIDINEGYTAIGDEITKNKIYRQVSRDYKRLKKKTGDTFERKTSNIAKRYNKFTGFVTGTTENVKKSAQKTNTQLDELLEISLLSSDDQLNDIINNKFNPEKLRRFEKGSKSKKYLIKTFITALTQLKPKLIELIQEEIINAAGCSQDQSYTPGQDLYLNVQSIDFLGQLKTEPDSSVGEITFEENDLVFPQIPFAMNKELYNRIQNIDQPFSVQYSNLYRGLSDQNLFDITYVEQDGGGNPGFYYKVNLANRVTGNKVKEFLKDYFKTIDVIDFKNIFANLMNLLTGAISIKKGDGVDDLKNLNQVFLILQRIFGLCFDSSREIDVSGSAKLSEVDLIDDSFFELTEVDLNFIDQQVSNTVNGVVEFTNCDNVKLPIRPDAIIDAIDNLIFVPGSNNGNAIDDASNLPDSLTQNPDWLPLEINIDAEFLKEFPKAVVLALLSPKVILPFGIILLSLGNNTINNVKSYPDFAKSFKSLFVNVTSKIGAIFAKIVFDIVKKDIIDKVKTTITDIKSEKTNKRVAIILALVEIITSVAKLIKDFRECRNVIQELQNLLKLLSKSFGDNIPLPLLLASRFLEGFSSTRATINIIGEFEKLGIPTGPLPDGSPNEFLVAVKAIIEGVDKEEAQNGKVQVACDGFSVTPIGVTIPGFCYGKKI